MTVERVLEILKEMMTEEYPTDAIKHYLKWDLKTLDEIERRIKE